MKQNEQVERRRTKMISAHAWNVDRSAVAAGTQNCTYFPDMLHIIMILFVILMMTDKDDFVVALSRFITAYILSLIVKVAF